MTKGDFDDRIHMFSFEGAVRAYPDRYMKPYADVAQLAEQLTCNQQVIGSSPIIGFYYLDGFPSGQRGQTVNLLATLSKVRILPHPLNLISRGGAVWKLVGLITRRS